MYFQNNVSEIMLGGGRLFGTWEYSFVEVTADVMYNGNRNLSELMCKSKLGINGSNNNAILTFVFLTSSFFHLLIKQKPDVVVKIISLVIFFFIGSSSRSHFLPLNWSISLNPYILLIYTRNQLFYQFHSLCIVILTRITDYY